MTNGHKREKSRKYPYYDLKECIEFAELISKIGGKLEAPISAIVSSMGIKSENNKRLNYSMSSSEQFGLISKSNKALKIIELAKKIIFYEDEFQKKEAIMEAFKSPPLYKELIKRYEGLEVPETLPNVLYKLGIAQSKIKRATITFKRSARFVGALDENNILMTKTSETQEPGEVPESVSEQISIPPVSSGYHNLSLSLSNGQSAKLIIPKNISKEDVEKLKKMLDVLVSE